MTRLKVFRVLLQETLSGWSSDRAARLAAALAYYTVFSLAPLLVIVIGIASIVFDQTRVLDQITGQVQALVGKDGAALVRTMIQGASDTQSGLVATGIGVATLLFGATGVFSQLHQALNKVWGVEEESGQGVWWFIRQRLLAFTMILAIGFLLLVSLIISAMLSALDQVLTGMLPDLLPLLRLASFVFSLGVITLLFAMIYKFLPNARIAWRDVWVGAGVTAVLFTIGKTLIGIYLGNASIGSAYGAAGSLAIILVWVYYSTQILLLGAEFTEVYSRKFGSRILPASAELDQSEEPELLEPPTGGDWSIADQ